MAMAGQMRREHRGRGEKRARGEEGARPRRPPLDAEVVGYHARLSCGSPRALRRRTRAHDSERPRSPAAFVDVQALQRDWRAFYGCGGGKASRWGGGCGEARRGGGGMIEGVRSGCAQPYLGAWRNEEIRHK
jgi:hypothetical protein